MSGGLKTYHLELSTFFKSSLFISTGGRIFTLYSFSMLKSSLYNVSRVIALVIIVVVIIIPALHGGGASV